MLWLGVAPGARGDEALSQWVHEQWQTDRGLPQNSVFCFAQDRDGFLWFGTESGLVRFDGGEFRLFNQHPPSSGRHEFISSLLTAQDGSIWAGARTGGLVRYRDEKFDAPIPELAEERVFALAQTKDGTIWIGTASGLKAFANGRLTTIESSEPIVRERVTALKATATGGLWIGGVHGRLARQDEGKLRVLANPLATYLTTVVAIDEDPKSGAMWIGYDGDGLFRFEGDRFARVNLTGRETEYLQALFLDREGAVWVGTEQDGIVRYKGGETSMYGAHDGLTTDSVLCLFRDREDSLWAGTLFGGLHRLHRGPFVTFGASEGLLAETVNCLVETRTSICGRTRAVSWKRRMAHCGLEHKMGWCDSRMARWSRSAWRRTKRPRFAHSS